MCVCVCLGERVYLVIYGAPERCDVPVSLNSNQFQEFEQWIECSFFAASRVVSCRAVCSSHIDHVRVAVGFRFVPLSRSISHANQSHLLLLLFNIRAGAKFLHSVVDYNESVATINSCSPKRLTKNNSVSNFFCSGAMGGLAVTRSGSVQANRKWIKPRLCHKSFGGMKNRITDKKHTRSIIATSNPNRDNNCFAGSVSLLLVEFNDKWKE